MEKRLNELKSLILNSVNVSEPQVGRAEVSGLSIILLTHADSFRPVH